MPRLASYPMHLRETVTPVRPGYLKEYAARVKGRSFKSRTRQEDLDEMEARLARSRDMKPEQKDSVGNAAISDDND